MKKLMIALVAGVIGTVAQAYDVNWGSYLTDEVGQIVANTYLVDSKTGEVADAYPAGWSTALVKIAIDGESGAWSVLSEVAESDPLDGGWIGGYFTEYYSASGNTIANGDILAVMAKLVTDDGTTYQQLAYYDTKLGLVDETVTVSGLTGDDWYTDVNFATKGNYTIQTVPEPTSGLLLLLGVAGLALRRRRA